MERRKRKKGKEKEKERKRRKRKKEEEEEDEKKRRLRERRRSTTRWKGGSGQDTEMVKESNQIKCNRYSYSNRLPCLEYKNRNCLNNSLEIAIRILYLISIQFLNNSCEVVLKGK